MERLSGITSEQRAMKPIKHLKKLFAAIIGLLFAAVSSQATLTTVNDIWGVSGSNSGEWNLYNSGSGPSPNAGIMEYLYGNFTRVNDANDIQWTGIQIGVSLDAAYAGASQSLFITAPVGSNISSEMLGSSSSSSVPSRSSNIVLFTPGSQPFLFLDEANGNMAYSDPTLNSGKDRMVTFAVTGYMSDPGKADNVFTTFADGTTHYVIAFEDGNDNDYNDFVVELSGVSPVPEPRTIIAGAFLLLPLGISALKILRKARSL